MNEIVNKFLLAGEKFMPEMHLKQPGLKIAKDEERTEKFMQTGNRFYLQKSTR